MPTIQQGPSKASISQSAPSQVKGSDVPVKRGFSKQNSYSRVEAEESVRSQVPTPRLDEPSPEAESDKATSEILEKYAEDADTPMTDQLTKAVNDRKNNPMGAQISMLQGRKGDLQKLGFSESQIDGLTALADPNSPDNSLAGMHSTSARVQDAQNNDGDARLNKMHDLFYDVVLNYTAIKEIPDDLRIEIETDLDAFTKAAFAAEQPLDIDSATTMLITIQSKLQNERVKFDQETIRIGQVHKEQLSRKFITKIREGIEKAKKASKMGLIGKIFGYLAIAVMAIATAILAVGGLIFTGGTGTVLAVSMMIAATALVVTMVISSETNNFMTEIFGDSKEGKIGAMVFWTAIIMALSLGSMGVGKVAAVINAKANAAKAAAMAASAATSTGATVAATGSNTVAAASTAATQMSKFITMIGRIGQMIGGASMVGEGTSQVATSVYTYQADLLRVNAMEDRAMMARIQQMLDDAMESLQTAIEELQQGYSVAANIIKDNHDTKNLLNRNIRG